MTYNWSIVDLSYNNGDILYHKLLAKRETKAIGLYFNVTVSTILMLFSLWGTVTTPSHKTIPYNFPNAWIYSWTTRMRAKRSALIYSAPKNGVPY